MGKLELRDIIAPSALRVSPKNINLGEKVARTLFVISYPRFLHEDWFSPVINLDKVFNVSIFIHPVDSAIVLRQLQKKWPKLKAKLLVKRKRVLCATQCWILPMKILKTYATNCNKPEKIFGVGLYITIYANSEDELNKPKPKSNLSLMPSWSTSNLLFFSKPTASELLFRPAKTF